MFSRASGRDGDLGCDGENDPRRDGARRAVAAMDVEDFNEVVGNLLDNARKWAASRIVVTIRLDAGRISIACKMTDQALR